MSLRKRSFTIAGHRTSIALEAQFWTMLEQMAAGRSLASLIAEIDAERGQDINLASALRVAALDFLLAR